MISGYIRYLSAAIKPQSLNTTFRELVEERLKRFPISRAYFRKLSTRHRLAYVEVVSKLPTDSAEYPVLGNLLLSLIGLIQKDYISGMTTSAWGPRYVGV